VGEIECIEEGERGTDEPQERIGEV